MDELRGTEREGDGRPMAPAVSLPKGGGAIRGIGEKFAADPVSGTGRMSVPIATSAARELTPSLSLSYDSGAGNGPFGLGWQLSVPSVTRRTETGLPRYREAEDSDVFVLSGADDLVPFPPGHEDRESEVAGYTVRRYRPRIEGGFARIERWTRAADGEVHWRVLSADNVLSVYGRDSESRIADPDFPHRVFSWLLCETRDDRGNAVQYRYKREDAEDVDVTLPHERGRGGRDSSARTANRYLKSVRYGNQVPLLDRNGRRPVDVTPEALRDAGWMFEVVFDYGEHQDETPAPAPTGPWLCRADPFSTHRPGFEVRTYRLCRRVLMFHHFPDEPGVGRDCLVAATAFAYRAAPDTQGVPGDAQRGHPGGSFLESVTGSGFRRAAGGGYTSQSLPPLTFTYTRAGISTEVRRLDEGSRENLPAGLDETLCEWVDLDGEGLPGALSEQGGAWYYKPSLGEGRLGPLRRLGTQPSMRLRAPLHQLTDLGGDGRIDLVRLGGEPRGFHTRTADGEGWEAFTPFAAVPDIDFRAASTQLMDLTGDGLADLLTCQDTGVVWYPALGARGFGDPQGAPHPDEDGAGPRPLLGDSTQTLFLADMSGDGLTDLVRIRSGEVRYWPNLGYGRFGAPVVMSDAPLFDTPDRFDPRNLHLADVDGSGTTDLLYVSPDGVRLWYNRSGNAWGPAYQLPALPHLGRPAQVRTADLLGNGTACLVWSSPLPADADDPLRYIDLMGGTKPHLLVGADNHMGAQTRVRYAPSTAFYLADRRDGRPWHTRLPFPVHVVEQVEHLDHVRRTRFTTRYAYHHGYYDGVEREFRGFGMVEQHDTEAYEGYAAEVARTGGAQETAPALYQPPVTTRTWFHTGAHPEGADLLEKITAEFYLGQRHLPAPELPDGLDAQELRECVRALKGLPLRSEVYSFDGSPDQDHPYSVTESSYAIERLQHAHGAAHAAFLVKGRETMTRHYDRDPSDPRIAHTVALEHGPHGRVLRSAAVVYGRQVADTALPAEVTRDQRRLHITCAEADYTPDLDAWTPVPAHRLGVAFETRSHEITGLAPAAGAFTPQELRDGIARASAIGYEADPDGTSVQKRQLAADRALFRDNALDPLPLGQWDTLALPYESYRLAFTPAVVADHYGGQITDADFTAAGYVHFAGDANWWIPSGTDIRPPGDPAARFFRPIGARDPFGVETVTDFDAYDLLPERVRVVQAPWNTTQVVNDYRVLAPVQLTDPNGNRSAVEFDALGSVVKTALLGKEGAGEGDTLADPTTRLEYELFNWTRHGKPNFSRTLAKEEHGNPASRLRESYTHLDGSGAVALTKVRTAPGEAPTVRPDGTASTVHADPRWIGTGRTIFNNKGLPVKSYEPYFSSTHEYDAEEAMRTIGSTAIRFYDPVGRTVRTELPDGTFTRTEYGQWSSLFHDANDTVRQSRWYQRRGRPDPLTEPEPLADPERRAAWLAAKHDGTPTATHLDSLGRPVLAVASHGGGATSSVRSETDLTGRHSRIFDQLGRPVASGFMGMAGTPVLSDSAERGRRWTFTDIGGGLVRMWDEHGRVFRAEYDALRRPVSGLVRPPGGTETVFRHTVYGDRHPEAAERNLLGTAHQVFDSDGAVRILRADFRGNPTEVERLLTRDHATEADWSPVAASSSYQAVQTAAAPLLNSAEPLSATSAHDALGRPVRLTLPDGTEIVPTYDDSGRPASIAARIGGQGTPVTFLKEQDYDALGRRRFARYGNDLLTRYTYDPETLRLTGLVTGEPATPLQDLHYTYDPVGNVTQVRDSAQQTHFFANQVVEATARYEYDALYQLVRAFGREHAGGGNDTTRTDADLAPVTQLPHVNDSAAVRTYSESYEYDLLGNLTAMRHRAVGDLWTRRYRYAYQDDPANLTNRLTATSRPGDPAAGPYTATYDHDPRGNMTRLRTATPDELAWDAFDRLRRADLGGGGVAHYRYGGDGQRTRKVVERPGGEIVEHIYLGPLEIHRRRQGTGAPFYERHTLHLSDDAGRIAQVDIKVRDDRGSDPANPLGTPLIRYQYGNHLGSATLETDESGRPLSYEEYHPYGTTAYRSGRPGTDLSLKRYRFAGKERDEETGLYYVGARYYAPWLGRWTGPDPAGFVDGLNLYRYCRNNPVMRADPDGLDSELVLVKRHPVTGRENFDQLRTLAAGIPGWHFNPEITRQNYRNYWRPVEGGGIWDVLVPDARPPVAAPDAGTTADQPPQQSAAPPPAHPPESAAALSPADEQPAPAAPPPGKNPEPGSGQRSTDWLDAPARSGGQGAVTTWDSIQRGRYVAQNRAASDAAQRTIAEAARQGDAVRAWETAQEASALRDQRRLATQNRVSPGGRAMSQAIEEGRGFTKSVETYSRRLPGIEGGAVAETRDAYEISRRVAVGAGESRASVKVLAKAGRVAGPVGLAVGIGLGVHAVATAPEGERGRIAARETGAFLGGAVGASVGMSLGVAAAGGISTALIAVGVVSGPIGWLAIGLGLLGALAVGWLGSKLGGHAGMAAYDTFAQ